MSSGPRQDPPARRSTSRAAVDALVASITLLVGAAMMVDSYGIGAGWADGSLQPGYFVVFSGIYASKADADAGVGTARGAGFGGAYSRQIAR